MRHQDSFAKQFNSGNTTRIGPEEAETIELGVKYAADWGTLNAAVFEQSIEGFQSNAFLGTGFTD